METVRRKNKSHWLIPMLQTAKDQYRTKLWEQRLMGVGMLIISAIFLWLCGPANEDCSVVLFTIPVGCLLLFSKNIWIA